MFNKNKKLVYALLAVLVVAIAGIAIVKAVPALTSSLGLAGLTSNGLLITNAGVNSVRITPATNNTEAILNVTNAANTINWLKVGPYGQIIMNGTGKVGIGTTTPSEKLSVIGNSYISGTSRVIGDSSIGGKLDVEGIVIVGRRMPSSDIGIFACDGNSEGGIYYNAANLHFYGCVNVLNTNSYVWKQLDN